MLGWVEYGGNAKRVPGSPQQAPLSRWDWMKEQYQLGFCQQVYHYLSFYILTEMRRKASPWQRNLGYPLAMLTLLALTVWAFCYEFIWQCWVFHIEHMYDPSRWCVYSWSVLTCWSCSWMRRLCPEEWRWGYNLEDHFMLVVLQSFISVFLCALGPSPGDGFFLHVRFTGCCSSSPPYSVSFIDQFLHDFCHFFVYFNVFSDVILNMELSYLMVSSVVGFYSSPFFTGILPRAKDTNLTQVPDVYRSHATHFLTPEN